LYSSRWPGHPSRRVARPHATGFRLGMPWRVLTLQKANRLHRRPSMGLSEVGGAGGIKTTPIPPGEYNRWRCPSSPQPRASEDGSPWHGECPCHLPDRIAGRHHRSVPEQPCGRGAQGKDHRSRKADFGGTAGHPRMIENYFDATRRHSLGKHHRTPSLQIASSIHDHAL